jgi:hypothetical protein
MEQAVSIPGPPQVREEKKAPAAAGIRYPTFIVVAVVLMFVALI